MRWCIVRKSNTWPYQCQTARHGFATGGRPMCALSRRANGCPQWQCNLQDKLWRIGRTQCSLLFGNPTDSVGFPEPEFYGEEIARWPIRVAPKNNQPT